MDYMLQNAFFELILAQTPTRGFSYFFSQLMNGLGSGSIYALIALGYSMVYGIVKLINFAHGEIIMVGGYSLLICLSMIGLPLPIAMVGSIFFCVIVGLVIERIAYRRMLNQNAPRIALLITAIGVSMFLQNLFMLIFGSQSRSIPPMMNFPPVAIGADVTIPMTTFINIGVSTIMMVSLYILVNKTKMGKAMRATSEDAGAAKLMGINTNTIVAFTFAIGSALAAVGAILYTNTYPNVRPTMGSMMGLKAFVAAVLGGIGNIPGAMLGGILLGIIESMTNAYISTTLVDAIVFGVLIVILLFKPTGLLGKNIREKV